uniref:Uncharacterized protein n=1 Tax=Glossina austeni TaxID=7395 RepID=A0A1A9UGW3_GLOAU
MSNSTNEIEKQLVNEAVETEIQRIRFNWKIREANYVENMLEEESNYNESLRRDLRRRDTISDPDPIKINPDDDFLQQRQKERAKAFHHFRVSRRIKKAKLKYRLQYVTNKLLESTDMLESVHDLIGEAEQKLISQGFSKDKIEILRKRFDVDEGAEIINNIKESTEIFAPCTICGARVFLSECHRAAQIGRMAALPKALTPATPAITKTTTTTTTTTIKAATTAIEIADLHKSFVPLKDKLLVVHRRMCMFMHNAIYNGRKPECVPTKAFNGIY